MIHIKNHARYVAIFFVTLIAYILLPGFSANPMYRAGKASVAQAGQDERPANGPQQGATSQQPDPSRPPERDLEAFYFEAYGQLIFVSAEAKPILLGLPEPRAVFEAPSCAFTGLDITYFYPGFELTTYTQRGQDMEYVLSVVITDDSVATPEGAYIGGIKESMERAYGREYAQSGEQFSYVRGKGNLKFILEDNTIVGIVYMLALEH